MLHYPIFWSWFQRSYKNLTTMHIIKQLSWNLLDLWSTWCAYKINCREIQFPSFFFLWTYLCIMFLSLRSSKIGLCVHHEQKLKRASGSSILTYVHRRSSVPQQVEQKGDIFPSKYYNLQIPGNVTVWIIPLGTGEMVA